MRFFVCCLLLLSAYSNALSLPLNDPQAQQRALFTLASQDIKAEKFSDAAQKIAQLKNYPLFSYIKYQRLLAQLPQQSLADINQFITEYATQPLARRLRLKALTAKAKDRQWQDVIALYRDGDWVGYQCRYLQASYHKNNQRKALKQVETIWLTGRSLPTSCDPLLSLWQKAGYKTQSLIWQRIELTLANRKPALAKYLAKSLTKKSRDKFGYWLKLYWDPKLLMQDHYWANKNRFATAMLATALKRLMYRSPEQALQLLSQQQKTSRFTASTINSLTNRLAIKLLTTQSKKQMALSKLDWQTLSDSQQEQILRALVAQSRWQDITNIYLKQQQLKQSLAWQYWYATSLENKAKHAQAKEIYQELALKRRYYGFLASDKLNRPYQLNHQTLNVAPSEVSAIAAMPAVQRALELLRLERFIEARREWYHLVKPLNEQQQLATVKIANSWQWHSRAIITLAKTKHRDDLDIRFPMPHLTDFRKEAKLNELVITWPLAIARQESAFMTNVRSSAGALGLMQLMPGTAKLQAKQSEVKYHSRSQLFTPAFNIKLGTGYLAQMLGKFDNNIAVAAAAYNAGPHRVKRWVSEDIPQDQWVETIPFRETREYVKNILTYTVIYQHHLQQPSQLPSARVNPLLMEAINPKSKLP